MKTKRQFTQVKPIATALLARLAPLCTRAELAGSLRRRAATVGVIEIVAIPKPFVDLFGNRIDATPVDEWINKQVLLDKITLMKNGARYKQFSFRTLRRVEYQVDLFLQPDPATWGVNFLLRTGSAEFSKLMVTKQQHGGALPNDCAMRHARIWRGGVALETPRERDVFALCGLPVIDPSQRNETTLRAMLAERAAVSA